MSFQNKRTVNFNQFKLDMQNELYKLTETLCSRLDNAKNGGEELRRTEMNAIMNKLEDELERREIQETKRADSIPEIFKEKERDQAGSSAPTIEKTVSLLPKGDLTREKKSANQEAYEEAMEKAAIALRKIKVVFMAKEYITQKRKATKMKAQLIQEEIKKPPKEAEAKKEERRKQGEHLKRMKIKHLSRKRSREDQQIYSERPLDGYVEEFIEKEDELEWQKSKNDFHLKYYVIPKLFFLSALATPDLRVLRRPPSASSDPHLHAQRSSRRTPNLLCLERRPISSVRQPSCWFQASLAYPRIRVGTQVSISLMEENQVKAYHENERQAMHKILGKYIRTCEQAGVVCLHEFLFRQIKAATNNFDSANKIGEGGFGSVYKGTLLDGSIIAVKQLSSKSSQGNREFVTEIGLISGLQHPNLVKLYGCCIEGSQLLLVYEYMENNSLGRALFGE
ncbi:hypothetical protein ACS0TY_017954 [Phlomoides rotata]